MSNEETKPLPNTIAGHWELYAEIVLPKDVSADQYKDSRRCFYAGAHAMLQMQLKLGQENVSPDDAVKAMIGWNKETLQFLQLTAIGAA